MPAIMTHDFFGKDIYTEHLHEIGLTQDERDAFLLGNQGPDPLFYLVLSPQLYKYLKLGTTMHSVEPSKLLCALHESLDMLDESQRAIGHAWALGFLCHYSLDRTMHPFVYSQQYAICDAGIEGLDRKSGSEVHGEIEREFDEIVLFRKLGRTIDTYRPYEEVLHASEAVLDTISAMCAFMAIRTYRIYPPKSIYKTAVHDFRTIQHAFYSPGEGKSNAIATIETRLIRRKFSFVKSMAHRSRAQLTSVFDNHEHNPWESPFTNEVSTASFWNLYEAAKPLAARAIAAFDDSNFGPAAAVSLTESLNFSGKPVADSLADLLASAADCETEPESAVEPAPAPAGPLTR